MSRRRFLHPTQTVTITRITNVQVDGEATYSETAVGTPVAAVEEITAKLKQQPGGENVRLALRLYLEDVATAWRERDLVSLTYRGETVADLKVEQITGPFGTGRLDHVELIAVSRLGQAAGFGSAAA